MGGATAPTPADLRAMLRLSHSLHTSDDAAARKRRLLAALCELLSAHSALSVVAHVEPGRRRHAIVSITTHGPGAEYDDRSIARCAAAISRAARPVQDAATADTHWRQIEWPSRAGRSRKLQHCLWSPVPLSDARLIAYLCVSRGGGNLHQPFSARERLLLHLAHVEMSWIYDADLLLATRGAATLSPRQRQTLQFLLAGHSEKQIAEQMTLSRNTVHHHVKAIHRHFGVSTRSELLARWVR